MLLVSCNDLLTGFICLELISFGLYVLVGFDRFNPKSNEGSLKYILLGALSSAILIYGISYIYGLTGSTQFDVIQAFFVSNENVVSLNSAIGLGLIIIGFSFKVAAVPFHMWAPDIYEGAPLPITAYISIVSKLAIFFACGALVARPRRFLRFSACYKGGSYHKTPFQSAAGENF